MGIGGECAGAQGVKVDIIFTVDLEPQEVRALRLALRGTWDYKIAEIMHVAKDEVKRMFGGLWLNVNLAEAAHAGQVTLVVPEGIQKTGTHD